MTHFTPPYPKPNKKKLPLLKRMVRSWNSTLDILYEKSYQMKMGKVQLRNSACHVANQPELIDNILVKDWEAYPKNDVMHRLLYPLLGDSIFTTNGDLWKKQRRMMADSFEQTRLDKAFPLMDAAVNDMLTRLVKHGDKFCIDVEEEMTFITADIIFRTILATEITSDDAKKIFEAFKEYQESVQKAMALVMYNLPIYFVQRRTRRSAKIIRDLIAQIIKPRHEAFLANTDSASDYHDILSSLMQAKDPETGHVFSYEELVDQICMLFLAGHETSASALSWGLYLAANCPELQDAITDEVTSVLGNETLSHRHIRKFKRTWQLFRETLRLYPPVGFFARTVAQHRVLRKRDINVGDTMIISPWLIHRHRDLWDQPDAFIPERFADNSGAQQGCPFSQDSSTTDDGNSTSKPSVTLKQQNKFSFLPFGLGPRICIGMAFANQEAILVLTQILKHYSIRVKPGHTPKPVSRATIRSDNGIYLVFEKRDVK